MNYKSHAVNLVTFVIFVTLFSLVGYFYFADKNEIMVSAANKQLDSKEDKQIKDITKLIPAQIEPKRILADLDKMKIYTYENGALVKEMDIVSKGKPESYYETPVGEYKIILKEKNHFSSIGRVYMPYSMQFFGNFFIHGIPYYQNGEKVSSTYSGGCVRLADEDAKYIYEFAEKGTELKVINLNEDSVDKEFSNSKFVKIMNALIALENVTMTEENLATVRSMVKNNSSDDARYLASQIGSSFYLEQMNRKAIAIGLKNTQFVDVKNLLNTTEEDKQKFVDYLYNNKFYLYTIAFN